MKIGSRVYVSLLSNSKVAGEIATVIAKPTSRGEVKVRTDFGVIGYPSRRQLKEMFSDSIAELNEQRHETDAERSHVQANDGYVVDTDVASMYLTPGLPLVIDPTDLLCHAVRIETPFLATCGWVTDQWIEDGVELLNVVFNGKFAVVPRSAVTHIIK